MTANVSFEARADAGSRIDLTASQAEILSLLTVHRQDSSRDESVDSTTLEWLCARGIDENPDDAWARQLVKGGFNQNISRAVSSLQERGLLKTRIKGYAITDEGIVSLTRYAESAGIGIGVITKPAEERVAALAARRDGKKEG